MLKKFELIDLICMVPFIVYLISVFPYFGESPLLDPMVVYRESTQFFNGGIKEIIQNGTTVHPPLIYLLNFVSFTIFGKNPASYNIVGTLIFFLGSVFLYFTVKNVFGVKTAIPMIVLLFLNPFVIIDSFYLMNDALILTGMILAIGFHSYGMKNFFSATLAMMVLMKETALVIIFSIFIVNFLKIIIKRDNIEDKLRETIRWIILFAPAILILFAWSYFLKSLGTTEWREPFFGADNRNSYIIVIDNLLRLKMFNVFLLENLCNAFILNFHWIYLLGLIFFGLLFSKRDNILLTKEQKDFCHILVVVVLLYIFLVFPFPTWTIPRYVIPVMFPFFFFLAYSISRIRNPKLYSTLVAVFFILALMNNYFSLDPLSLEVGNVEIINQTFYDMRPSHGGPDRIIYNLQFLDLTRHQNNIIKDAINKNLSFIVANCNDLKLGEKLYSIGIHNDFYPQLTLRKQPTCMNG